MLLELKVSNFAIIDHIHIEFKKGFNVLSGETGAGKSILLKSLALLMGNKAQVDSIKSGCETSVIEGLFDLSNRMDVVEELMGMGITADDEELIVRRQISANGKSRVYLNGNICSLHNLRKIVTPLVEITGQQAPLIEMTGQNDNKSLQSKSYHLNLLDQYSGSLRLRDEYLKNYQALNTLKSKISEIENNSHLQAQRLDFLKFQQNEIATLELSDGDEEQLIEKIKKLKNASQLTNFVEQMEYTLYSSDDSALTRIHRILKQAQSISASHPEVTEKIDSLEQAKNLIDDSLFEIRQYCENNTSSPKELETCESKLSQLRKLQKKFGTSLDEINKQMLVINEEINSIESSDVLLAELKSNLVLISKKILSQAEELHGRSKNAALLLSEGVNSELEELNMKGLQFIVSVKPLKELKSTGLSDVEFLTRSSKNDTARSLGRFASGGELSRILLSLKQVLGQSEAQQTYLFDEVDTGVSGETAEKVGRKLKTIAQSGQVICVTHLPQVAAFADNHFLIKKSQKDDKTHMSVIALEKDTRVNELARLLSGEKITATSLAHARELLESQTFFLTQH